MKDLEILLEQLLESLNSTELEVQLVTQSIQVLEEGILIKAKFYEGDLLMTVLSIKEDFWKEYPTHWKVMVEMLAAQSDVIKNHPASFEMKSSWYTQIEAFRGYDE